LGEFATCCGFCGVRRCVRSARAADVLEACEVETVPWAEALHAIHADRESNSPEPSREARWVLQLVEASVSTKKRILGGVLCLVWVFKQLTAAAIYVILIPGDEYTEGFPVPAACLRDDFRVSFHAG